MSTKIRWCLALCVIVTGCTSPAGGGSTAVMPSRQQLEVTPAASSAHKYIKHIVIVIQENRSFENIFAGFPGAHAPMYGYTSAGQKIALQPSQYSAANPAHDYATAVKEIDGGKMDGFDVNSGVSADVAYSYLERDLVSPYWTMAQRYVLADHMFPTILGASFTAHLALIASQANIAHGISEADYPSAIPWGCDASGETVTSTVDATRVVQQNGPFPCFTQFQTMADTLDAAHVSWKYYAPALSGPYEDQGGRIWSVFDAIANVRRGADWNRVVSPPTKILTDAQSGGLPQVAWVVPDVLWSDHPDAGPYGPSWVAGIVNEIGKSKQWSSTAIVVLWDDWGGYYDNVPPPQLDFRGLGIRVGCIIISPYVQPHVSHTVYEFGSILKFVEQVFGLPHLGPRSAGYTDGRATSIIDSFDFIRKPRSFHAIPAPYPPSFFISKPASLRPPDEE